MDVGLTAVHPHPAAPPASTTYRGRVVRHRRPVRVIGDRERTNRVVGAAVAVLSALALVTGCSAPPVDPPVVGRVLSLPDIPSTPRSDVVVDATRLDDLACERCRTADGSVGVEEFLYGDVAVGAVRSLAGATPLDPALRPVVLGDLVASGYHGGRWLAAGLDSIGVGPADDPATRQVLLAVGDRFLGVFADLARDAGAAANRADPESTAALTLSLAAVAGYNRGYVELALERPPPGVAPPFGALTCGDPVTCTSARFPLDDVDRWGDVGAQLAAGEGRWGNAAGLLGQLLPAAEQGGRDVWIRLLDGSNLPASGYLPLIDTSAGFLAITGLALRAALHAWATGDAASARAAYDLTAGLALWAGSYFVGLAAPPGGPLPTLDCGRLTAPGVVVP